MKSSGGSFVRWAAFRKMPSVDRSGGEAIPVRRYPMICSSVTFEQESFLPAIPFNRGTTPDDANAEKILVFPLVLPAVERSGKRRDFRPDRCIGCSGQAGDS
jgi:hypothetical protein